MSTTTPVEATRPLVLALDVGTSSARAVLYDSRGRQLEEIEGRTPYQMTAAQDGGVEINADQLIEIVCQTIDECLQQAALHLPDLHLPDLDAAIGAVGYSNFWHAMLGVDARGDAITPLYNWSDTRSATDAKALGERLGADWIHARTGVVPHASYYPAKILWLRRADPGLAAKVARWISIGEYLYSKIFGLAQGMVCGVSMASGTGLFNPNLNRWDEEMLAAIDLPVEQLSPLAEERAGLIGMRREFAERWPALRNARWLPAVGDGAASNVGSGCSTRDLIALNVGTSGAMRVCWEAERVAIPKGLWCYRANRRYALIGGALSNAGDVHAWCKRTLRLAEDDQAVESQLAAMEADGHGLTVLPFFSGERSTGWHGEARAAFVGLNLSIDPVEILRASMEAVCYRFAAIHERLKAELPGNTRIVASGGGILHSGVWTQMMADVIGVPVAASAVAEASSRGAALLALEAFGQLANLSDAPTPLGEIFEPNEVDHQRYLRGWARQEQLYDELIVNTP